MMNTMLLSAFHQFNHANHRFRHVFASWLHSVPERAIFSLYPQKKEPRMPVPQNEIREMIQAIRDRIVERFHPDKVILFGSHARGEAGPDSDVDILVVLKIEGSKRRKSIEIGIALHDIPIAKDILVSTPEEYEWRKEVTGTIEYPASHEGVVLYDKS
jgi:predicted nucleotidyltransferase